MRQITKDIEITIDGKPVGFRLTKLDAFSAASQISCNNFWKFFSIALLRKI